MDYYYTKIHGTAGAILFERARALLLGASG
jgi:hypothetical protein